MDRAAMQDRLRDLFEASPGRLAATCRTVLAVVLVALVMITFRMPFLAVGPYLVFIFLQRNLFLSRFIAILLVPILALSCFILYLVAAIAWDHAWLRLVLWIGIFWGGFFLMHILAEPRLIFAPLCIVALVSYAFDQFPYPNMILDHLGWIWALFGVCATCTFLTQWLTGVPTAREHLQQEFQRLSHLVEEICRARASGCRLPAFDHEGLHEARELAEKLGKAQILSPTQSVNCDVVLETLGGVAELAHSSSPGGPASDWMAVAEGLRIFEARILGRSNAPGFSKAESQGPAALALDTLKQTLSGMSRPGNPIFSKPDEKGLVAADAFTNPAHAEFATRAMCATIGCYLLMSLTSWDGIHTCMITCVVTALVHQVERHRKQRLRLGGALFGGLMGVAAFVYLVPLVDGIIGLLAILAAGTAVAAWVAQGSTRVSYAGLQIALAFYMILLQSPHAETNLDVLRDRLVGILLGIAAMRIAFAGFQTLPITKPRRPETVPA